jgi:hypothetical protein
MKKVAVCEGQHQGRRHACLPRGCWILGRHSGAHRQPLLQIFHPCTPAGTSTTLRVLKPLHVSACCVITYSLWFVHSRYQKSSIGQILTGHRCKSKQAFSTGVSFPGSWLRGVSDVAFSDRPLRTPKEFEGLVYGATGRA